MKTLVQRFSFTRNKKEKKATDNSGSGNLRKILSKVSGAFMLPIAVMSIAGLLLGVGAAIAGNAGNNDALATFGKFISSLGSPVFDYLPILFAAAFVIAFTDEAGVGVFSAIIGYLVFNSIQSVFIWDYTEKEWVETTVKLTNDASETTKAFQEQDVLKGYTILFGGAGRSPQLLKNLVGSSLGIKTLQTSVFGGLSVGLLVAFLYNRFHQIQLPQVISFFGGKRFVAIITIPSMIVLSFIYLILWPWVGAGLSIFGNWLGSVPYGFESFICGWIERSLIPFGLHHVFYAPLWYSSAGGDLGSSLSAWETANAGHLELLDNFATLKSEIAENPSKYQGDSYTSQSLLALPFNSVKWSIDGVVHEARLFDFVSNQLGFKLGRFMDGKFSFMIFGLPGAGLAMILAAPKENRKVAAGTIVPSVVTSIVTGVTEPIEFTFLFLAPWLFWGVHGFLCALSFMIANLLNVHVPMSFSGGLLDLVIYGFVPFTKGTNAFWPLVVGVPYFFVYFGLFYVLIKKFNIETPGRGSNTKLFTKADFLNKNKTKNSAVDPKALAVVLAYGGIDNITAFNNCASRLRYDVKDGSKVNEDALKAIGASGVRRQGDKHVQAIFGPVAEQLNSLIKAQREKIREYILQNPDLLNPNVEELVKEETAPAKVSDGKVVELHSPALGKIKSLKSLNDGVFSEKMSGDGFVVEFSAEHNASVFSPVDGVVSLVFPTKHAYGITTKDGVNVLLHIGIDTVNLNGKGFEPLVEVNQKVSKGDLVAKVNLDIIREAKLKTDLVTVILPDSSKTEVELTKLDSTISNKETVVAKVK